MHLVDRSCREVIPGGAEHSSPAEPRPLSAYRDLPAYVLIGDPGAGKTTAFEQECGHLADDGVLVSTRDFLTFDDRPEWRGKTLFIDGLDEIRAGAQDARTPFDAVRTRLDQLGRPRFRLSCRGADWLGALDRDRLAMVSPGGRVPVLSLEPLTERDIREILDQDPQIKDAGEFLRQAERKGLLELLSNPQTLGLLAEAAAAGAWPGTRRETFELACRKLIGECNPEHRSAAGPRLANLEWSLRAAGFLCAVQIIAGKVGYALTEDEATEDFPWLGELSGEDQELFASVACTKLFKCSGGGWIAPVHRQIAEYLAARHIAGRIERSSFPVGRILASITGAAGIVVSQLRGLSAWLATLCTSQRDLIIDRDPMGVALYGDIKDFSVRSKSRLLNGLGQHINVDSSLFQLPPLPLSPLGTLATPDMKDKFQEILLTTDRSDKQQEIVSCVIDAMLYGTKFPSLRSILMRVVRDPTWRSFLRERALIFLLRYRQGATDDREFKILMEEIRNGRVTDSRGALMGLLLLDLYPRAISFPKILDYLYVPQQSGISRGRTFGYYSFYTIFWERLVLKVSEDEAVSCLDQISPMAEVIRPVLADSLTGWGECLVMKGLQECGEDISTKRLHQWLGLIPSESKVFGKSVAFSQIQEWLQARPVIQAGLLDCYFDQCSKKESFETCMVSARSLLFKNRHSLAFGRWCLEKFMEAESDQVLRYLAEQAISCYEVHNVSLPWEKIGETAKQNPKLTNLLHETCREIQSSEEQRRSRLAKQDAEVKEWLRFLKSNETALQEGTAPLALLHGLGQICLGRLVVTKGSTPRERLEYFLRHDQVLLEAAVVGLRYSICHPQIPSVGDIIRLHIAGKIHQLSLPVLAGLELGLEVVLDSRREIRDAQWKLACTFHMMSGESPCPAWYSTLVVNRPELVAGVLQTCVAAVLKSSKAGHWTLGVSLRALACDDNWAQVAHMSAMEMLRVFPVRASKRQFAWLNATLHAGLRHSEQADLLALIRRKVVLGSMNVGTRIRWLAAGMFGQPEEFQQRLVDFVNSQEKRVWHLADFCSAAREIQFLSTQAIELLFRKLGQFCMPYEDLNKSLTHAEKSSKFIYRLLYELGSRPTSEAAETLARLSAEPKLSAWQSGLQVSAADQQAVRREAGFRHLNVRQVNRLLNNQQPANADDLKALAESVIQEVSDWIRNGDTDDYRQYWNEGPRRELLTPKHEEACRDALLSDLRKRLGRCGVEPEAHRADDTRADAVVAFGGTHGFEVPIEIKKSTSPDLWRGMHDQLVAKYARDPRADGRGLYVVFWFGANQKQPSPPQGARPRTAGELEARLRDTLSPEEARQIAVCVVDVAAPKQTGAAP